MQFGKSSEKLRAKTERQIQEAQERISALQEEMAETLGEQYDPAQPSALRQSSARKPLPASLPRETRVIRPEEECCPACGGDLSPLGCDVSEQLELICQRQDYWPFFAIFNVRYWSLMLSAFRHFIITDWRGVFCQHSCFAFFL